MVDLSCPKCGNTDALKLVINWHKSEDVSDQPSPKGSFIEHIYCLSCGETSSNDGIPPETVSKRMSIYTTKNPRAFE